MENRTTTKISLAGRTYSLSSEKPSEYMHAVANFVSNKIAKNTEEFNDVALSEQDIFLLSMFELACEYKDLIVKHEKLETAMRKFSVDEESPFAPRATATQGTKQPATTAKRRYNNQAAVTTGDKK